MFTDKGHDPTSVLGPKVGVEVIADRRQEGVRLSNLGAGMLVVRVYGSVEGNGLGFPVEAFVHGRDDDPTVADTAKENVTGFHAIGHAEAP
jgi:hypothetical protein